MMSLMATLVPTMVIVTMTVVVAVIVPRARESGRRQGQSGDEE